MTREEALEKLDAFIERATCLIKAGETPSWKLDRDILMSDIAEFAKSVFDHNSPEFKRLRRVYSPKSKFIHGSEWSNWVKTYGERLLRSLELLKHRLDMGQAQLRKEIADEHLIEPATPHSAYVFLRDIVESASRFVFLVDPYVDRTLFSLLSNVANGVEIRILTRKQNVPADFLTEASKFRQQTGARLECRTGLNDFHDRFLVVDDKLFFSGASFKDLGKKGSVVAEVNDIKARTLTELETRWKSASPLK